MVSVHGADKFAGAAVHHPPDHHAHPTQGDADSRFFIVEVLCA